MRQGTAELVISDISDIDVGGKGMEDDSNWEKKDKGEGHETQLHDCENYDWDRGEDERKSKD